MSHYHVLGIVSSQYCISVIKWLAVTLEWMLFESQLTVVVLYTCTLWPTDPQPQWWDKSFVECKTWPHRAWYLSPSWHGRNRGNCGPGYAAENSHRYRMFDRGSKDEHSACVHARAAMPTIVCVCGFVRIHITSQLAGKGYKDSDYTLVIAIMHWQKRIIIVQKLTLVVELWALLSPCCPPSLERMIWQCSSQERPTKILST